MPYGDAGPLHTPKESPVYLAYRQPIPGGILRLKVGVVGQVPVRMVQTGSTRESRHWPGPDAAIAHQPQVLEATVELESRVAKRDSFDAEVKELAVMAAAVSRLQLVRRLRLLGEHYARHPRSQDQAGSSGGIMMCSPVSNASCSSTPSDNRQPTGRVIRLTENHLSWVVRGSVRVPFRVCRSPASGPLRPTPWPGSLLGVSAGWLGLCRGGCGSRRADREEELGEELFWLGERGEVSGVLDERHCLDRCVDLGEVLFGQARRGEHVGVALE